MRDNQMSENQYLDAEYGDDDDELVAEWGACPKCGERCMGELASDDGTVTCATCGNVYEV